MWIHHVFWLTCLYYILTTSFLGNCQHYQGTRDVNYYQMRTGSQCFHVKGVPTLKLRCPSAQLIKVHQAFYGAPPVNSTCWYSSRDNHCIQYTDLHENCMGRYMCSVYVSNPFLMNCRVYANYMQVNYTCIPKHQTHDICKPTTFTTTKAFIRTPNYPESNYTANLNCACIVQTEDPRILLQILDFSLNHTRQGVCESDYLKISGWGKKCGYIGAERLPERLELDRQELKMQFVSDFLHEARGFWIQITGSKGGPVTMTCGQVRSSNNVPRADEENEIIIIDGSSASPSQNPDHGNGFDPPPKPGDPTLYDFVDPPSAIYYNVDNVQIATGCVVGVLILIAVIIIIVLVFRR